MMLPSSECADDIWLAGKVVAEVEARVRAIKEKGYRMAGFRLQGAKCESVIIQKEIAVEQKNGRCSRQSVHVQTLWEDVWQAEFGGHTRKKVQTGQET